MIITRCYNITIRIFLLRQAISACLNNQSKLTQKDNYTVFRLKIFN
ncbi:hypothetical protein A1OE_1071 [Candidatus Endolissoclinum faulkneri L2]|uniref:Uncharacterized protein n=1 Tax=Candidatus Endolissoclinum faulkneri L2 TaxID=1193729 RepID=K7YRS2_9PROT|nr:hypothetical protein A1OE_1071 [Candidatus Endolissoclinum faulkneri L2]